MSRSAKSMTPHIEALKLKYTSIKSSPFYREIQLILLCLLNILLLICLFSFNPHNNSFYSASFPTNPNTNFAGKFGAYLSHFLIYQIGFISFVAPLPLSHVIWLKFKRSENQKLFTRLFGWFLLLSSFSFFMQNIISTVLVNKTKIISGGKVGLFINELLQTNFWYIWILFCCSINGCYWCYAYMSKDIY